MGRKQEVKPYFFCPAQTSLIKTINLHIENRISYLSIKKVERKIELKFKRANKIFIQN